LSSTASSVAWSEKKGRPVRVKQVALGDQLAIWMDGQPLAAAAQELVDLVGPDPVVLVVVQHRQKDEEVFQQVLHLGRCAQPDGQVATVAPGRKVSIEGDGRGVHRVAERFEQSPEHALTTPAQR